jgi:hypothetical protein
MLADAAVSLQIRTAFLQASSLTDDRIVLALPGSDPECDQILKAFGGRDWKEVPSKTVRTFADALPLFTPAAFRYYLPAYMLASLEEGASEPFSNAEPDSGFDNGDVMDFVLYRLTLPESAEDCSYFLERAQQFSRDERGAVARYLETVAERKKTDWPGEELASQREEIARAIRFWAADEMPTLPQCSSMP